MNTTQNRNRFAQPLARILRQFLSGFALETAVREHLHAARPGVAHGSSRTALGLRPTVKHACNPAQPGRLPASRPRRKPAQCPAPPQGAVWRQVPGSHNKKRAGEANPLTPANSPRSPAPQPDSMLVFRGFLGTRSALSFHRLLVSAQTHGPSRRASSRRNP